jgi:predicted secreted Zn-dependent protease
VIKPLLLALVIGTIAACGGLPSQGRPSSAASPSIRVAVRESLYAVNGTSFVDLKADGLSKGPFDDGERRWALTDSKVHFQYKTTMPPNGACGLESVDIDVTAVVTLPEWQDRNRASVALAREWYRFLSATRDHEHGHVTIAVETAHAVETAIRAVGSRATCEELGRDIDNAGNDALAQLSVKQRIYDRDTDHGRKTGALLTDVDHP